ncbi:MAG TPA: hypothetical protein VI653_16860 [Steroidobacteraceae bacterium]
MSSAPFSIDDKPIKEMTDAELQEKSKQIATELQGVGNQLNFCIQQMQLNSALLNVLNYELNRRAHSIQIAPANSIPH